MRMGTQQQVSSGSAVRNPVPCVRLVVFVVLMRAHVQFCRFEKADRKIVRTCAA